MRVLFSHAGGRIGLGFARALRLADPSIWLIAVDSDRLSLYRAIADEKYLVPPANHPSFLSAMHHLAESTKADLLWVQHEREIRAIAAEAGAWPCSTFLPARETILLAQDKSATYSRLRDAGLPVPFSMPIDEPEDLTRALSTIGGEVWLRSTAGAGGAGALPVADFDTGKAWIDLHHGWGRMMAAERLRNDTISWQSIWDRGRLIAAQGQQRLAWEFTHLTLSGVTGISRAHRFISDPAIDALGQNTVNAMTDEPHGVFGVDMAFDGEGRPRITEVNAGRFFSGGAMQAARAGGNLPYLAVCVALGKDLPQRLPILNPLPADLVVIHGVGTESLVAQESDLAMLPEALAMSLQ